MTSRRWRRRLSGRLKFGWTDSSSTNHSAVLGYNQCSTGSRSQPAFRADSIRSRARASSAGSIRQGGQPPDVLSVTAASHAAEPALRSAGGQVGVGSRIVSRGHAVTRRTRPLAASESRLARTSGASRDLRLRPSLRACVLKALHDDAESLSDPAVTRIRCAPIADVSDLDADSLDLRLSAVCGLALVGLVRLTAHNGAERSRQLGALRSTLGSPSGAHCLSPTHAELSDFASSVTAIEIANTLTPLLAGALVPRFGAGRSAVVATAANAIGQALALVARLHGSLALLLVGFVGAASTALIAACSSPARRPLR